MRVAALILAIRIVSDSKVGPKKCSRRYARYSVVIDMLMGWEERGEVEEGVV
jgi:hypothetical protein